MRLKVLLIAVLLVVSPFFSLPFFSSPAFAAPAAITTVTIYQSNRNYFIENNGAKVTAPQAVMALTGPLVDTDLTFGANSWTLQLNTYQPFGFKPALSQYVIGYENGGFYAQDYFVAANDAVLYQALSNFGSVAPSNLIAGAKLTILLNTNSTGNVLSATYSFTSATGTVLWTTTLTTANKAYAAPVVGWQFNLIGLGGGSTATFTSASGTFTYSSPAPILWTGTYPGNESYVQYKGFPGSVEKSNIQYSLPAQSSITSIIQTFGIASQSQPLLSTTTPQKTTFNPAAVPKYFGTDIGLVSWQTTLAGFKWNTSATDSLTVKPQAIGPNILSITQLLYNSSTTAYQFSGSGYSVNFYFKANNYQLTNIISGTVSSATVIRLVLSSTSPAAVCDSTSHSITLGGRVNVIPPCTQACFGKECYDWSDVPLADNPAYNNVSHSLTFTVTGTFVIDPLALDGTGRNGTNGATSLSCTLTTSTTNDIVFAFFTIYAENSHAFTGISDTASLSWASRVTALTGQTGEGYSYEYWAKSSGTLSSDSITVTVASSTFIGMICWGVSGASTASNPFDPNAGLPFKNTGTTGGTYAVTWSTSNNADFVFELAGNSNVAFAISTWGWGSGTTNRISDSSLSGSGVDAYGQFNITAIKHTSVSATMTCNSCGAPWQAIVDAVCSSAGCSGGTVTQGIKITLIGTGTVTIGISGCAPSNSTFTARTSGTTTVYSGMTASCTVTLTEPTDGASSRYRWNISPHPFPSTSITFGTCASGTCSTYSNNTYYQLLNNYSEISQTPNKFDGVYIGYDPAAGDPYGVNDVGGTYLGTTVSPSNPDTTTHGMCFLSWQETGSFHMTTTQGGNTGYCIKATHIGQIWADYNTNLVMPSVIGNTWNAQGNFTFADTTGGNHHNVNYVQSTGGGGSPSTDTNYLWLLLIPFILVPTVIALGRRR